MKNNEILLRPEFLASVVAIVVVLGAALYFTRHDRRKALAARAEHPVPPAIAADATKVFEGQAKAARVGKRPPGRSSAAKSSAARPLATMGGKPGAKPEVVASPTAIFAEASGLDGPPVTFADVAGLDEAIEELREVKEYLADPERFRALGAELPKGILLCGHPGNGKTLLARALAGEAGVPFYFVSASSFVEQYVGLGAARIRSLFEQAKGQDSPAIVFIDELDAIGLKRSGGGSGEREFDHSLNQLLVELDGFASSSGVLILGATNRPELLDPALVRPGRFDRRIQIDRPDFAGRLAILRLYAARRPMSRQVDWEEVASQTTGLSGAELANLINEASLLAARRYRTKITADEVHEAVARVSGGARSSRLIGEDEKRLIAYHEAGHALLSLLLKNVKIPPRVSIVPRAVSSDKSAWSFGEDRSTLTKRELMAQLIVLLGGRAAEVATFGEPSTRSEDDLDDAAKLARKMVERWAMTGRFELAGRDGDAVTRSRTESRSEPAVAKLLSQAEQAARSILQENGPRLVAVAEHLVHSETLTVAEMARAAGLPNPAEERIVEQTELLPPSVVPTSVARIHG
ncbi:MAG: ATP-dependent metallopeptidase FtsH/Yme1/Tma family protein [Acidimicrobiales bacterium]